MHRNYQGAQEIKHLSTNYCDSTLTSKLFYYFELKVKVSFVNDIKGIQKV